MFNQYDYNDNIGYCKYVFEKNEELGLNLKSSNEIQYVANNYLDEVYARGIIEGDEIYQNDKILLDTVNKLEKKFRKFKSVSKEEKIDNISLKEVSTKEKENDINEMEEIKMSR